MISFQNLNEAIGIVLNGAAEDGNLKDLLTYLEILLRQSRIRMTD